MSLSRPRLTNPSTRWIEWKGGMKSGGILEYYDKEKKERVVVPQPFTFILLDELARIGGYVSKLESGVYSNEVKDQTCQPMIVKAHKGGVLLEGLYREIKDRLPKGASFGWSCYIGFKDDSGNLAIGNILMIGSSLSPWIDFKNSHRADFGKNAITIDGATAEKNGDVDYLSPKFFSRPISAETINQAKRLDEELQAFLDNYFAQPSVRQTDHHREHESEEPSDPEPSEPEETDDIPF